MIKWFEKNRQIPIILTSLLVILIFTVSSIPGSVTEGTGTGDLSILYHFLVFFFFSFFLIISIKGQRKIKLKYFLITIIISIAYAILDEVHQLFVPLRNGSVGDVLVDSLGILIAMIVYLSFKK